MICSIAGVLTGRGDGAVSISVEGISYQVLLPLVVEKALETRPLGEKLQLETIYYLHLEQSRANPILIGFENGIQREFFERLLTVPRMGPKGALGAFARSVSTVAGAIESADYELLQSLPGVGKQRAKDMVATLQGKVAKFALMQDADLEQRANAVPAQMDTAREALQMLLLLGHKRNEAERMVAEAIQAEPDTPDAETLVRVIYRKQQDRK